MINKPLWYKFALMRIMFNSKLGRRGHIKHPLIVDMSSYIKIIPTL